MVIYLFNIVSILFYAFLYSVTSSKYSIAASKYKIKKFFIIMLSIQLILILALRNYSVGVDVSSYFNFFNRTPYFNFQQFMDHRFELGYKLLNKAISIITMNEQIFLTVMAIICILPVGRFVYRHSRMPFLSLGLYIAFNFYAFTFSGLRQGIAYGIILISYDFIVKRKLTKFVICVLLASLFHTSALIFLPAYFLAYIKINKKSLTLFIIISTLIFLFRKQIFEIVILNFYPNYEMVESNAINWMMLGVIIIILGLIFYKRVVAVSPQGNTLYVFMIMAVFLMMFATVGTNAMRMVDYYYIFMILFIPEVLNAIKEKSLLVLGGYVIVISVFVLHLWFLLYSDTYQIVPYNFFWN